MKKTVSLLLSVLMCCSMIFAVPCLAETETQWENIATYNAEQLSSKPAGTSELSNARVYENDQLTTAKNENGNIINAPVETVAGYSQKMFAETYMMWGFCTPLDGKTHNIKVVVRAGLYTFDDVAWSVNTDGYLDKLDFYYDSYNMVGYQLAGTKLWYNGEDYNALPTKHDEKGYSYKELEFDYSNISEWSEGLTFMGYDMDSTIMSMVLNKVSYYDSDTGELLREVDENDIAYGTLNNLTGIVQTDHTYTDRSCGEVFKNVTYDYFISDVATNLTAGNYMCRLNIDAKDAVVEITNSNGIVKKFNVSTSGKEQVDLAFTASADDSYYVAIKQLNEVITLQDISILKEIPPLPQYTLGDLNNDGEITAADALIALQSSVSKITLDETQLLAANVNTDTTVTAADALLILQYAVKKITVFPIQEAAE